MPYFTQRLEWMNQLPIHDLIFKRAPGFGQGHLSLGRLRADNIMTNR